MYFQHPIKQIHIITQPLPRKKTQLDFLYSTGGSWFEKPKNRGQKHLLEHCIASRTSKLNFEELKDYSFQEDIQLNAYTSDVVMALNAVGHSNDFDKMFDILLEMFLAPTFDQSILNREKEVVLREISERRGDPNYRLYFDVMKNIYTPDSLECHEVLGDIECVSNTTLDDFYQLHQQNLQDSHLFLMFSGGGDLSEKNVLAKLDQFFASNPKISDSIANSKTLKPLNTQPKNEFQDFSYKPIISPLAHEHAEVSIFIPVLVNFDKAPAITIFDNLFIKYGGTLHNILRDELQYIYGISGNFHQDKNMLELQFSCEIPRIESILDHIKRSLSDPTKFLPIAKFDIFKPLLHKKIEVAADSLGSETKFISERLLAYGKSETYSQYLDRLNQVSYADVLNLYQEIKLNWEDKKVVVVSNSEDLSKQLSGKSVKING